jgi:hypothetical protein
MLGEQFINHVGDGKFVRDVLLLLPLLVGISPLVRARPWLGVFAAVLFFGTSLSMLIVNGCDWRAVAGFFSVKPLEQTRPRI